MGEATIFADAQTLKQIEALASLFCTQEEAALVLGCSPSAFARLLDREPDARGAWDKGFANGRLSLRRKQMKLADVNAGMAIFLGKNYLGQKDEPKEKPRGVNVPQGPALTALSHEELKILERAAELVDRASVPS
jgi:hypothetical protein